MKVIVFGATGGVGQQFVQQAKAAGHDVSVFVRNPSKLESAEGLDVITGDAFDTKAVADAIAGHDAVVSALGSPEGMKKSNSLERMGANIAAGMTLHGVTRLIYCASAGVDREIPGAAGKAMMWLLRNPLADHRAAIKHFTDADLDLTVARPMALGTEPLDTNYLEAKQGVPGNKKIPRASVAHFMLKALENQPEYSRSSVGLSL